MTTTDPQARQTNPSFILQSSDFKEGQPIPPLHSCEGMGGRKNISPALSWSNAPTGTKSFVLIMSDPDAPRGTWDHWVLFNIPETITVLSQGISDPSVGIRQGRTSWNTTGYGGPCPPSGTHRYLFEMYALDGLLDLPEGSPKQVVLSAMNGHVLAKAILMGTYAKH